MFRTENAQDVTADGQLQFAVATLPSSAPEVMTYVFLAMFAILLLGALMRTKGKA